jgi:hypothetical protein
VLCRRNNNASLIGLLGPVLGIEHRMLFGGNNKGGKLGAYCIEGTNNASSIRLFGPVLEIEHRMLFRRDNKGGKLGAY